MQESLIFFIKTLLAVTIVFDTIVLVWTMVKTAMRGRTIQLFALLMFHVLAWEVLLWVHMYVHVLPSVSWFLDRTMFAVGGVAITFILLFIWDVGGRVWPRQRLVQVFAAIAFLLSLAAFIPGSIVGERVYIGSETYQFTLGSGPLFIPYHVLFTVIPFFAILMYVKAERRMQGVERTHIRIVGRSLLVASLFAIGSAIIWPFISYAFISTQAIGGDVGTVMSQTLSATAMSIFTFSTAYATMRYRFMDIHVVLRKFAVYSAVIVGMSAGILLIGYMLWQLFGSYIPFVPLLLLLFFFGDDIKRGIRRRIDDRFFVDEYDMAEKMMEEQLHALERKSDVMVQQFVRDAARECGVDVRLVVLREEQRNRFVSVYPDAKQRFDIAEVLRALPSGNNGNVAVRAGDVNHPVVESLELDIELAAIIPVFVSNSCVGFVGIGSADDAGFVAQAEEFFQRHLPVIARWRNTFETAVRRYVV